MRKVLFLMAFVGMCSCTLFNRQDNDLEMEKMSEAVLKHKEGLEIDFKPLPEEKK